MTARRNIVWYGLPRLFDRFAAVLLLPLYARVLTTTELGVASVALAVGTLAGLVVAPGAETVYLRFAGRADDRSTQAAVAILHLGIMVGGTALLFVFAAPLAALVMPGVPRWPFYAIVVSSTALSTISAPVRAEWRATHQVHRVALLEGVQSVASIATIIVALLWLRLGPVSVLLGDLASSIVAVPVALPPLVRLVAAGTTREGMARAWPLMGVGVPTGIYEYAFVTLDRLSVNRILGAAAVAIYAVSYQIGAVLMMAAVIMNKEWRPLVFHLAATGEQDDETLQRLWTRTLCVFLALGGLIAASAHEIVIVVAGQKYADAAAVVPWVVLVGVLRVPRVLLSNLALAASAARDLLVESVASMLLFVAGLAVFIPAYGLRGAAWAGAIAYAAGSAFLYSRSWNTFRLEWTLAPWVALFVFALLSGGWLTVPLMRVVAVLVCGALAYEAWQYWRFLGVLRPLGSTRS